MVAAVDQSDSLKFNVASEFNDRVAQDQSLFMEYLRYWSLLEKPFGRDASARFFYGPAQREAIARVHYTVAGGMSCGILISPPGCGMTSLLRHIARSSGFGDCAVEMLLTRGEAASTSDIFRALARALRINTTAKTLETDVRAAISATSRQSVRTVWLIDGARDAATRVARSLIDTDDLFTVIAGTSPEYATRMAVNLGACPLKIELPPLSLEDTGRYLLHSLYAAGCNHAIFADPAIVRLHEISGGQLTRLSQIAELALLVGAAKNVKQIQSDLLEAIHDELVQAA